ncbi:MAG: CdvA-like protein, partial [Candidatus Methanomethylicia archaeon]
MHLWIKEFEKVVESIKTSNRRLQTLIELMKSKRISQLTFEYLKRSYESEAKSIEERRRSLLDRLRNYLNEIDQQIKSIEKRIVSIEERYTVGEIDEESYKKQIEALQTILQGVTEEFESVKK